MTHLFDDTITIKQISTPCNLYTTIGEKFDGLCAVVVYINKCNLIEKLCGLETPLKPTRPRLFSFRVPNSVNTSRIFLMFVSFDREETIVMVVIFIHDTSGS